MKIAYFIDHNTRKRIEKTEYDIGRYFDFLGEDSFQSYKEFLNILYDYWAVVPYPSLEPIEQITLNTDGTRGPNIKRYSVRARYISVPECSSLTAEYCVQHIEFEYIKLASKFNDKYIVDFNWAYGLDV